MAIQKKKRGPAPARRAVGKKRTGTAGAVRGIALSFLCGAGCCLLLLCAAALAFAHTALPLALARPVACAAAAGGAFVSGLVLARSWGRRKLLAGLGCGGFTAPACCFPRWRPGGAPQPGAGELSLLAAVFAGRYGRRGRGGAARPGRPAEGVLMRAAKTAAVPLWRAAPAAKAAESTRPQAQGGARRARRAADRGGGMRRVGFRPGALDIWRSLWPGTWAGCWPGGWV